MSARWISLATFEWTGTQKSAGRALRSVVFIAASVYVGFSALIYFLQESLIFQPTRLPAGFTFTVPGVRETTVKVEGAELSALHFRQPDARGLVFFLHGNAGNLSTWLTDTSFYRQTKYDLFMIDYRGYGKSTGRIQSEEQLHADVRAAFDHIAPQYAGRKIVLYGRSLGTAFAAKLAAEVRADLTVLVSPFTSLLDMAKKLYPWLPEFVGRYAMRNDEWVPKSKSPVLILHGEADDLIPIEQGRKLKALHPAAEFLAIEGAGHNDIQGFPRYLDALTQKLDAL
jgi:uncharacterized protein